MALNLADIRTDYMAAALDEESVGVDPLAFFQVWFEHAQQSRIHDVNAMTLATVDADGRPHARIVLLKGLENGEFVFFTNYDSDKGQELSANPHAALLFFWHELERQIRIEGRVSKVEHDLSDAYFESRPEGSKLGAWASPQSREIATRQFLDLNFEKYRSEFSNIKIPRPSHWGGYRVMPERMEYWQGRPSRMHDRILFKRTADGGWEKSRLAP
jgi:pyridoxamine 5'-phosphate oxidase